MATDNHNENNTSNLKADRQYLVSSGTNRLIMTLLLVGGISVMALLLFLAAYGKTGRYTDPDRTQFEATLNSAAAILEGGTVAPDNEARVTLPIDTAIRAVADKGLGAITSSLKQTGTPPAPAQVAPVEEVMPTEEVAPVEATETTEVMTAEVVETVSTTEIVETVETMATEVVETVETTEVMTTTEITPAIAATAATAGVAAVTTAVIPAVTETVEASASTVVTTTPVVEATTSTETVSTSSQTITANTTGMSGSTLTMSNGMTVQINKDVYNACVVCHQVNGQGIVTVFPPLANHAAKLFNQDRNYLPNVVLYGIEGEINVGGLNYNEPMRGYPEMSDEDIAGVLNYVLTTWGNESLLSEDFQPYDASEIADLRGQEMGPEAVQAIRAGMNLN